MKYTIYLILTISIAQSCKNSNNIDNDATIIANLQFESRKISEEKFSFADSLKKITFTDQNSQFEFQRKVFLKNQDLMTKSIDRNSKLNMKIDSLYKNVYKTEQEKKELDAAVEKKIVALQSK
jgi:hypothetical protein